MLIEIIHPEHLKEKKMKNEHITYLWGTFKMLEKKKVSKERIIYPDDYLPKTKENSWHSHIKQNWGYSLLAYPPSKKY
jgi:hypothetical protein